MYDRSEPGEAEELARWDGGVSWMAHPDEGGKRASHALEGEDGLWVLDPLDATNIEDLLDPLEEVAGVAVLSCWHTRDAETFANRYDVGIHVPAWMDRVKERVDAPVHRYTFSPGDSGFEILPCRPFPLWQEVFCYEESTATLVIPDSLGTIEPYLVSNERLGLALLRRLQPPTQIRGLEPERILVGHGDPITTDAPAALETALADARKQFPRAVRENGEKTIRSLIGALE